MTTEEFLKDVCPNHTDKSKWNKSELLHILELHTEQLHKHFVSNRRELFDKFYEWLDGLSQTEYDDMSITDKCEKFFFKT